MWQFKYFFSNSRDKFSSFMLIVKCWCLETLGAKEQHMRRKSEKKYEKITKDK